ncbi:hypothetical protein GCM10009672_20010 [Nesterenkonia lutea]
MRVPRVSAWIEDGLQIDDDELAAHNLVFPVMLVRVRHGTILFLPGALAVPLTPVTGAGGVVVRGLLTLWRQQKGRSR